MKITKTQLREIIKEEIQRLHEREWAVKGTNTDLRMLIMRENLKN